MTAKNNYILPIPFHLGPYGSSSKPSYKRIISMSGANDKAAEINTSNEISAETIILDEVLFQTLPDSEPEIGGYLDSCHDMQVNTAKKISQIWDSTNVLLVYGGDHSISIGTGLGLSKKVDMSKVGLLYIDTHTDINIPETSQSKSITGYPVAVNMGLGPKVLVDEFNGNFIKKVAFIGVRDVDKAEFSILKKQNYSLFSSLDVEELGASECTRKSLEFLADCEFIWLSIDVDVLEQVYFEKGETDEPAPGGLTLREVMQIAKLTQESGKLKVAEITQINDVGRNTPIIAFASRLSEIIFGIGKFRYGKEL
jgi:arginase